jgi:hypothetical protein
VDTSTIHVYLDLSDSSIYTHLLSQLALVFPADLMRFVPPDGAAFADAVENFWQGVVKIAKKLRACRLYAAQRWYNAQRQDVIQMTETFMKAHETSAS